MQVLPALAWVLAVWVTMSHGAPQLRFSEDGLFKVMIFNDLHFGDDPDADERTLQVGREWGTSAGFNGPAACSSCSRQPLKPKQGFPGG